ncbi:MAG TPA: M20/M25/M40 family metallo-hydrolase [Pyrinomonadaceae bacterium]|nr:M20/M25/M40 family metallo-hydrolase [Pyrinomonadaceae bacterium]
MISEHSVSAPSAQAEVRSATVTYVGPIAIVLLLGLLIALSIYTQSPPRAVPEGVAASAFSASRAMRHLAVIAAKPHPTGSAELAEVRNYLIRELSAAGLTPQIQSSTLFKSSRGAPEGGVQNVIARLKGTGSGRAVLLMAHYDSVKGSFGASDDGSSVATLLETLRTLKAGEPLKNDVIFLFTDAEEPGLLGAKSFIAEHPWAADAGLVLNFEARGNTGPVIMFESSDNNGWLIDEFAKAAPYPVAHSLSYEIYRLLPNDTDLTVFKEAGVNGFNFAAIDGLTHYHSPLDNLSSVDPNMVQHQGSYAVGLARHFGNLELSRPGTRNDVYFDLFGRMLVHYSSIWVMPLTLLVGALFVTLLVLGLRKRRLTARGIVMGALALLVSILAAGLAGSLLWKVIWMFRGAPSIEFLQSRLFLAGFVAVALAITAVVYVLMTKRTNSESLALGAILWWLLLTLIVSVFIPGGSFLFHWPLLFSMVGVALMIWAPQHKKFSTLLMLTLCAVPAIILWVPVIYQIFIGLTLNFVAFIMAMVVLVMGLLVPLAFTAYPTARFTRSLSTMR